MRKSLKELLTEYGAVGIAVYLASTCIVCLAVWFIIMLGWRPQGAMGTVGVAATVYGVAKLTQPFRIEGSVAITPFIARLYERMTGKVRV